MNRAITHNSVGKVVIPSLALFICLLVVEVPITVGFKASVVVAIQTCAGVAIYKQFTRPRHPTDLEIIVLGFAIGVALSTLCDMALRTTTGFAFGWILPAAVCAITSRFRGAKTMDLPSLELSRTSISSFIPVVTIAFLYMAQDSVWPLWIFAGGICICITKYLQQDARWTVGRWAFFVIGVFSICLSFADRPPFWWYITDDFRVFESLSISVTKFGPGNPLGALGTLGLEYHFMTYAFSGIVDATTNAPPFLILSQFMPTLTALLLSATVWMFIERDGGNKKVPNFFLAAAFPIFFDYSFTSPSYCFGLIFYLVAIFFWTDNRASTKLMLRIPINIVLAAFVVTTKISNLPTVLAGLACVAVYGAIRRKQWALIALINFLSTFAVSFVYFIFFLANSRSGTQINSTYFFGFAQRIAGDISTVDDRPTRILVGLLITSIFLVLPILGYKLFLTHKWHSATMLCLATLPAIPLVIISALIGGQAASGYFVLSSLNILNIALIVGVSHYFQNVLLFVSTRIRLTFLISATIVSAYVIQALQIRSNGGGQNPILFRALLAAHWLPALLLALIWFSFQVNLRKNSLHLLLFAVIIAEVTFFAAISFQTRTQLTKGPELTQEQSAIAIGTPDQIDAGEWIRDHTPENAILASNYFCENACQGSNWFEDDFKLLDATFNFPPSPNGYGSFDMILPIYAERRFLIQGSRFLLFNGMDRDEIRSRMSTTLQFANYPNPKSFTNIRNAGVTYFVVDRKATDQDSWEPFAKEIYRNSTYIVLELDSI
jgi:hypothetical protein